MTDTKALLEEASARQRDAAAPDVSAWVSANAGTGKTHVLVDRVARLLLAGAEPSRILCITYTKAAAAEMETRLFNRLGEWSLQSDKVLQDGLKKLQDERPEDEDLKRARRLFARALETPGGLKIQTIHAFCQSVLKRFPLEAGVHPNFTLLEDETARELQTEARRELFTKITMGNDAELTAAHEYLVAERDEAQIATLLAAFMVKGDEFDALFTAFEGASLWDALWRHLGLAPGTTRASFFEDETRDTALDREGLCSAADHLRHGSKKSNEAAERIVSFLESADRPSLFDDYIRAFLTAENKPLVKVTTKGAEAAEDAMRAEQSRLLGVMDRLNAVGTAERTRALLTFGRAYLDIYTRRKRDLGGLDFNDLIIETRELLAPPGDAWVHYKLDEGIDHILVDEAQDTSPQQWRIVDLLAREMTAGESAAEDQGRLRSLFAVGDVKQSIYRFQGAAPEEFAAMRDRFAQRLTAANRTFRPVELDLSFRSASPILDMVDEVFRETPLSSEAHHALHHAARFADAPGVVELWPEIKPGEEPEIIPWDVPLDSSTEQSPEGRLAARIAATIKGWLDRKEKLTGAGRPIVPSDVMILVRRRSAFMEHMIRALKNHGIPVAGADRLHITAHIAVMDLMSLGAFALSPSDDLTLAEVLKSPFIGLNDEQLYDLAYGRKTSLWASLKRRAKDNAALGAAFDWLSEIVRRADFMPPYEFYANALSQDGGKRKMLARLGPDAEDPIEEFMTQALLHERARVPSLQSFLHAFARDSSEIKRDMEKGRDEVRVMTVHGAKGLESEIVFLPDTCTLPKAQSENGILTSHAVARDGGPEGEAFFLYAPRKGEDDPITRLAREAYTKETEFEYRRLFYVAMTRARERLYICGWTGKTPRHEGSWHALAERALENIGQKTALPDGTPVLRLAKDGPARDGRDRKGEGGTQAGPLPPWALAKAAPEHAPRRLSPSSLGEEPPAFPPGNEPGKAAKRGQLVHRMLEVLPDLAPAKRQSAARQFLDRFAEGFSAEEREELARETLALMALPNLAPLFGAAGQAEVALSGIVEIGGRPERIEGRVDRLAVTAEGAWVLDYKTNRPAAGSLDEVSPVYLRQMAGYRALLHQIYPRIKIHCALVWTHKPELMVLPEDRLEAQWVEIARKSKS